MMHARRLMLSAKRQLAAEFGVQLVCTTCWQRGMMALEARS